MALVLLRAAPGACVGSRCRPADPLSPRPLAPHPPPHRTPPHPPPPPALAPRPRQVVCAPRLMGVILQHCRGRVDACVGEPAVGLGGGAVTATCADGPAVVPLRWYPRVHAAPCRAPACLLVGGRPAAHVRPSHRHRCPAWQLSCRAVPGAGAAPPGAGSGEPRLGGRSDGGWLHAGKSISQSVNQPINQSITITVPRRASRGLAGLGKGSACRISQRRS